MLHIITAMALYKLLMAKHKDDQANDTNEKAQQQYGNLIPSQTYLDQCFQIYKVMGGGEIVPMNKAEGQP